MFGASWQSKRGYMFLLSFSNAVAVNDVPSFVADSDFVSLSGFITGRYLQTLKGQLWVLASKAYAQVMPHLDMDAQMAEHRCKDRHMCHRIADLKLRVRILRLWTKCFTAMAPKLILSSSKVIRLSQDALLQQLDAWDIVVPAGADDLDIRALLSRAMRGKPPLQSPEGPPPALADVAESSGTVTGLVSGWQRVENVLRGSRTGLVRGPKSDQCCSRFFRVDERFPVRNHVAHSIAFTALFRSCLCFSPASCFHG